MSEPCTALAPAAPDAAGRQLATAVAPYRAGLSIFDLAKHAYASGMFKKLPNASAAVMVLQLGRDVGVSDTAALTSIHFFEGKPTMSGNMLWGLVLSHPEYRKSHVKSKSDKHVTLRWIREIKGPDGKPERILDQEDTFSEEDAKRAGLLGKDNWKKFPKAMLFNRAVSTGFKMYAAHLAMGNTVYTPDELGGEAVLRERPAAPAACDDADFAVVADEAPVPATLDECLAGSTLTRARLALMLGMDEAELASPSRDDLKKIYQLAQNQKRMAAPAPAAG